LVAQVPVAEHSVLQHSTPLVQAVPFAEHGVVQTPALQIP
jgi:hypothetical protein